MFNTDAQAEAARVPEAADEDEESRRRVYVYLLCDF